MNGTLRPGSALILLLLLPACGSGGGSGGALSLESAGDLEVGIARELNRPLVFDFNRPVDLGSVDASTLAIREVPSNTPVEGSFSLARGHGDRRLVFQPRCPLRPDLVDASLQPGRRYRVELYGKDQGGPTVRSRGGTPLRTGGLWEFDTTASASWFDPLPGRMVRPYRVWMGATQVFPDPAGGATPAIVDVGLNLAGGKLEPITIVFDHPLDPDPANWGRANIRIEWDAPGGRVPLPQLSELVSGCQPGGVVVLTPLGALPAGAVLDLVIRDGLLDALGTPAGAVHVPLQLRVGASAGATQSRFVEEFDDGSFEDVDSVFREPRAKWGAGGALAAVGLEGGDPHFEWLITTPTILDTDFDIITDATGTRTKEVRGGIVDVRSFTITASGMLSIQGSNPLVLRCSGPVEIAGRLVADGLSASSVNTVCTTAIPEPGAPGRCGGGSGGDGSFETTTSTIKGESGRGAYDVLDGGGDGGDSGVSPIYPYHRPGGGGGGTWIDGSCSSLPSATRSAEGRCGIDGHPQSSTAWLTQPARGGAAGPAVFTDGNPVNDFFGMYVDPGTGAISMGELATVQGGAGGGAGGDSIQAAQVPHLYWNSGNILAQDCDLKGAGGGAGAGVIVIRAWGELRVSGEISADGGAGASGENIGGINTVGGGSGGGAGGHIILMSLTSIDLTGALLHARGGVGGRGSYRQTYPFMSAGGHGGFGVIQLHVEDPATQLAHPGATPPGTPVPWVLAPDLGSRSRAQTKWIPTGVTRPGSGGVVNPPQYAFAGTDPVSGEVLRSGQRQVLPPRIHRVSVPETSFSSYSVRLPGPIPGIANPAVLVDWELVDEAYPPRRFRIVTAARDGVETVIGTDPSQGDVKLYFQFVQGMADVGIHPRYFRLAVGGDEQAYPETVAAFVDFQGADPDPADPSLPDLSTLVPDPNAPERFTPDVAAIAGRQLFRVRFRFDLNTQAGQLPAVVPELKLERFALPFRF